jgi:hypothetical protein
MPVILPQAAPGSVGAAIIQGCESYAMVSVERWRFDSPLRVAYGTWKQHQLPARPPKAVTAHARRHTSKRKRRKR